MKVFFHTFFGFSLQECGALLENSADLILDMRPRIWSPCLVGGAEKGRNPSPPEIKPPGSRMCK
jgi:hypothetical protein